MIAGPSEPKRDINAFITPLVEELQRFLVGVDMFIHTLSKNVLVRCALLCIAWRPEKYVDFLDTANLGCNKCIKLFPGSVGKKDYSGFERNLWRQRCLEEHTKHSCNTKLQDKNCTEYFGIKIWMLLF